MRPSVNEVLQTLNNANVCTNTMCFETAQDAGFGNLPTENNQIDILPFLIFISAVLLIYRPNSLLHAKVQNTITQNYDTEID